MTEKENIQEVLRCFEDIDTEDMVLIFYRIQREYGLFAEIKFVDESGSIYEVDEEADRILEFVLNKENVIQLAQVLVQKHLDPFILLEE